MKTTRSASRRTTSHRKTSKTAAKKSFNRRILILFILFFLFTLILMPFIVQNRQNIIQHADVIYSGITPEFYCLGLGGIDCDGVKTSTESALGCVGLAVTKNVNVNKKIVAQGETIEGSIIFKNGCKNVYSVQEVFIAARDPKGGIHKFVPGGGAKSIYPAQTVSIDSELAISPNDPPGKWIAFGAFTDEAGRVITDSSQTEFTVAEPCTSLSQVNPVDVDPNPVVVPASASATVTYKNECLVEYKLQDTLIQAVDPNGNSYDFQTTSVPPVPVNLAPGSTVTFTGTRSFTTADILGMWNAYAAYQTAPIGTMSAKWNVDNDKKTPFLVSTPPDTNITPIATNGATPATKSATPKSVPKLATRTILFDFDKSDIKPAYNNTLNEVVKYLQTNPTAKISIVGHTDNVGTPTYNMTLSQDRANAVKNYIVSKGIAASRMTVSAKGESQPVASNATEAGRAKNRRVVITN